LAERAASAGGLDTESPLFNNPDMQRFLANIGGQISEGQVENIQTKTTGMTAADEARDIQTNPENPLYEAYRGSIPDRKRVEEARQKVAQLQAQSVS
jgi:hypothetical protein